MSPYRASRSPNTCGWRSRSQNVSIVCTPATVKRSVFRLRMAVIERASSSGPCRVSASVKSRNFPLAAIWPLWHAHCLPIHPAGRSGFPITVTRGSVAATRRAMSPVPSTE